MFGLMTVAEHGRQMDSRAPALDDYEAVREALRKRFGLPSTIGRTASNVAEVLAEHASATPTRSAETTGSVGEADGGAVPQADAQPQPVDHP